MNFNRIPTGDARFQSRTTTSFPHHLIGRLYLLGIIAVIECVACFPNENLLFGRQRYLHIAIVSYAVFLGLGHSKFKAQQENLPFGRIFFCGHFLCIAAVFFSSLARLMHGADWLLSDAVAYARSGAGYAWSAVYLLGTVLLALACVPLRIWIKTIRATNLLWLYSSVAGVAVWALGFPLRSLWDTSSAIQSQILQVIAYRTVLPVLRFFLTDVVADPAEFTLGTIRYTCTIAGSCSGIEGLGLVFAFSVVWLWYYRKETRFARALMLIPCALGCIWLLNIVRLCALIFIGDAGYPEVAEIGFHSQFGWIAFTVVALAFSMATQRLSWVQKIPATAGSPIDGMDTASGALEQLGEYRGESPAIRAYLLPFLAILAAASVSKLVSGYFDWLYPLRFVVAAVALCYFWPELKKLNWRFGWIAPVAGVAVFLMWMAPTWWGHQHAVGRLGTDLAALSPAARWGWIAFRVAAAVVTVPIAEELAFRGYLARRLMDREFDRVPFTRLTALAIVLSSVAFGLMHGQHWLAGILAGVAYAFALRWRGRMGDAVVAHAVSNLLLAAWVLGFGDWAQW